jgi:hypothetical protein
MKAEQRHELQKNELANWIGRVVIAIKTGPRSTYVGILVGCVAIFLFLIWWWNSNSTPAAGKATVWTSLSGTSGVKELEQLAEQHPKTMAARTAWYEVARAQYAEGVRDLMAADTRADAIAKLQKVREIYQKLVSESAKDPILNQEALLWSALAEESLIGASTADKPSESIGSVDRAIELYDQLVKNHPGTPSAETATKRLKDLKDNRKNVESFYAKLNEEAKKSSK